MLRVIDFTHVVPRVPVSQGPPHFALFSPLWKKLNQLEAYSLRFFRAFSENPDLFGKLDNSFNATLPFGSGLILTERLPYSLPPATLSFPRVEVFLRLFPAPPPLHASSTDELESLCHLSLSFSCFSLLPADVVRLGNTDGLRARGSAHPCIFDDIGSGDAFRSFIVDLNAALPRVPGVNTFPCRPLRAGFIAIFCQPFLSHNLCHLSLSPK